MLPLKNLSAACRAELPVVACCLCTLYNTIKLTLFIMTTNNATPPKVIGPSDRIELNVGGDIFHSTVATLASNSAYFASQLSGNYKDTAGDGVTQVFLDQDPASFRKLLAFMREGMIDAAAVDRGVLLLAEYLQMDELLVAIKARAYKNLHPGSIKMDNNVAAEKFDKKYGGIRQALANGYLPAYLKREPMPMLRKKKLAMVVIKSVVRGDTLRESVILATLKGRNEQSEVVLCGISIVGALNWLHSHGYTEQLDVLEDKLGGVLSITFARYSTKTTKNELSVFTPEVQPNNCGCKKEFAMIGLPRFGERVKYAVEKDPNDRNPWKTRKIDSIGYDWLANNGYFTCETAFGDLLQAFMECQGNHPPNTDRRGNEINRYPFKIYSRPKHPIDEMENESDQEMIG